VGSDSQVLWPLAPSGDGQGKRIDALGESTVSVPVMRPNLGSLHLSGYSGDGLGHVPLVQPTQTGARVVSTAKGEVMKLVMLVVFFLLWISTASTLLFLYMDRYLFPG
jgi:hypothetical protein